MNSIIEYHIIVSFSLITFYILFLWIRNEKTFQFNRIYLISSLIVSLILPFLKFNLSQTKISSNSYVLESITIRSQTIEQISDKVSGFTISGLISGVYIFGSVIFLILLAIKIRHLIYKISKSQVKVIDNKKFYNLSDSKSVFSFFNYICINQHILNQRDIKPILEHELTHAKQKHSFDIILIELIRIFFWYNPVILLYKKSLQETHEYLADAAVLEHGSELAGYQMLLLSEALGFQPGITNNFNYSLTKKRIKMMKSAKKIVAGYVKLIAMLPVILVFVTWMSCNSEDRLTSEQQSKVEETVKATENEAVTMPEFPGGQDALRIFIAENVKYPEQAIKEEIQGKVFVSFTVKSDGKIANAKIVNSIHKLLDNESVRVVNLMPEWTPATKNNVKVDMDLTIPINYKLDDKK